MSAGLVRPPASPGTGPGWDRLGAELCGALPAREVDGVWVFRNLWSGPTEFGTAIISRVDGDRRRIYTARYALTVKGRQRGGFEWGLDEVGSGPLEALEELLDLVPVRGVDAEPLIAIDLTSWFPAPAPDDSDVQA